MIGWMLQSAWQLAIGGGLLALATAFIAAKLPEFPKLWRIPKIVALATVGLVAVSLLVETEEERIGAVLHEAAAAVEAGKYDSLAPYIHPREKGLRRLAEALLQTYEIDRVAIKSNLKVAVDRKASPPRAVATFNVVVRGSRLSSQTGTRNVPRFVVLKLEKQGDQWKVIELQHYDPTMSSRTKEYRRKHGVSYP